MRTVGLTFPKSKTKPKPSEDSKNKPEPAEDSKIKE